MDFFKFFLGAHFLHTTLFFLQRSLFFQPLVLEELLAGASKPGYNQIIQILLKSPQNQWGPQELNESGNFHYKIM